MNNEKNSNKEKDLEVNLVEIAYDNDFGIDSDLIKKVIQYQFIYSICGLIMGLLCTIGGIILLMKGISGSINLSSKTESMTHSITNASPGVILFFVGLYVVWATKFKAALKNQKQK